MKKIRIGNDFVFNWAIERGGLPEDLSSVLEKHLHLSVFGKRVELVEGVDYDIIGNVIRIEVTPTIANIIGTYKAELHYILPDNGLIDEDRKCAVDVDAFQIVAKTAQADDSTEFSMTSDMAIAFKGDKGDSAYQVWLDAGNTGTEEDYFAYLRQPATDAIASIQAVEQAVSENESLRITSETSRKDAEDLRLSAEILRNENETERVSKESVRIENETERVSKEGIRQSNEIDRVGAESERGQAESERETAELTRQSSESERNEAEGSRVNAESLRVTAESSRELAESLRVDAEILRQTNTQTAITNAEEATLNANTAAQNANDAREAIQSDLALKANQTDLAQLESDVEQLAYVKIKNKAVNGNFENGLVTPFSKSDGLGSESTLAINSSTPISGNYDIRFTIITPATSGGRPMFRGLDRAGNIGDKIYLHFYAKILSGIPRIYSISDGRTSNAIYGGDVINGRNTRIIDVGGIVDSLGIIYFDSTSVWDMQMDNFMRINLTETFGAGNEPTEEEMNLLLDIAGISYIDDEVVIPAQKIMQWQLALIRKNKNAIIALGGTII